MLFRSLTRGVPPLIAWFVNPLLKSIPREYLSDLMDSTRVAVTQRGAVVARSS